MKIDYAIVSSDSNPMYIDFWPVVRNLWNRLGIKPILALISDKNFITDNGDHIIHEIKSIDGVNTGFQSQISRMYITKFYMNNVCITSDIDMFPLSKEYFSEVVNDIPDDSLAILSSDAYNTVRYPICYNVASGQTFDNILKIDTSFQDYCTKLLKFDQGWDTDELYFGKCVSEFKDKSKIFFLNRGWTNGIANGRIDRSRWSYNDSLLKSGLYIDSHSLRPYSIYKNEIQKIINILC
jgi:hypothetical protein